MDIDSSTSVLFITCAMRLFRHLVNPRQIQKLGLFILKAATAFLHSRMMQFHEKYKGYPFRLPMNVLFPAASKPLFTQTFSLFLWRNGFPRVYETSDPCSKPSSTKFVLIHCIFFILQIAKLVIIWELYLKFPQCLLTKNVHTRFSHHKYEWN